jgi:sialidase-1
MIWSMTTLCVCAAVLFLPAAAMAVQQQDGGIERTRVWRLGSDGYQIYRIPAAVVTPRGTLLVFAEGRQRAVGPGNDAGEINTLVKRSTDNGRTFSEQTVVGADGPNTYGNPCPVVDEITGRIWLLSTHNLGHDHEAEIISGEAEGTRTIWITYSDDDGLTWAEPHEITDQVKRDNWTWYATGPGNGIQLRHGPHNGRLVIPCDYVLKGGGRENGNSHIIYSDDNGQSWQIGGEPPGMTFNESQVVELSDGRLMLNMRNYAPGGRRLRAAVPKQRGVAVSNDGGQTFGRPYHDSALIEPICQASIIRYTWPDNGGRSRILFSNPASTEARERMTVRLSYDEGSTWPVEKMIHPHFSAYSSLVALPDGMVGLLYEAAEQGERYQWIEFVRFSLEWLTDGQDRLSADDVLAIPAPAR